MWAEDRDPGGWRSWTLGLKNGSRASAICPWSLSWYHGTQGQVAFIFTHFVNSKHHLIALLLLLTGHLGGIDTPQVPSSHLLRLHMRSSQRGNLERSPCLNSAASLGISSWIAAVHFGLTPCHGHEIMSRPHTPRPLPNGQIPSTRRPSPGLGIPQLNFSGSVREHLPSKRTVRRGCFC